MEDTNRRKQIIYRANHRGIKEMDIIVGRYATEKAMTMDPADLDLFETILNQPDRDLFSWHKGFSHEERQVSIGVQTIQINFTNVNAINININITVINVHFRSVNTDGVTD